MRFVLRMAVREMRAAWRRLLFFFVCVAVGVGAIVALRSVIQNVRGALAREAKGLMAADVIVQTNRPWELGARDALERRLAAAPVLARTESIETATMVRPADETKAVTKMVELHAVQPAFPLYGAVEIEGGAAYSHARLAGRGALVRPELLTQLGIAVGDGIIIGGELFTVRGVILSEPGRRVGAFSFGGRVLIDHADLEGTGLLTFGSRASYRIYLRVADSGVGPLVEQLGNEFRDRFVRVRSYQRMEDQIGKELQRAENYLSLVGLVIVILGGIGVSSVTRVFVRQKVRSIAILKCVGGTTRQILATYLVQVASLGLAGSLLGIALAAAAIRAVPADLKASLVTGLGELSLGMTSSAIAQGFGIGMLVSLLFSLVPLMDIRLVKPLLLLRHEVARDGRPGPREPIRGARAWLARTMAGADRPKLAAMMLVGAALVALTAWQAASWRVGLYVCLGFAGVALALNLAGLALMKLVRPLGRAPWFPLRHAVMSLTRPGNQTRAILLAVGLGSFFIIGVRSVQDNLLDELALELREGSPDMFLLDVQKDQVSGLRSLAVERTGEAPLFMPVLRARVTAVKGREVNLERFEDVRGRGSLGREYVITYRDHLQPNERVLEGRFWPGGRQDRSQVSIEESIRERFRINVGDLMRFDVMGRIIHARVTSVRHVDWRDARRGGFMFVFRPGAFDGAPHAFVAPMRGPVDPLARARLQRDLVARFPNVSVIDVREVMQTVQRVIGAVTLAISIVGAIALASGGLILVGSVAMTKFQRVYEAAIFKTLGASTRLMATMLVLEYGTLGALAGAIGSLGAIALTWALARYAFDIGWRPALGLNFAWAVVTTVLVAGIGVLASLDALRHKPLATLRAE